MPNINTADPACLQKVICIVKGLCKQLHVDDVALRFTPTSILVQIPYVDFVKRLRRTDAQTWRARWETANHSGWGGEPGIYPGVIDSLPLDPPC